MKTLNHHQIEGRLVADPELKELSLSKKVMLFDLAYETPIVSDLEGSKTSFIRIETWDKKADYFLNLLYKGLKIMVTGDLVQKRWKDKESLKSRFILLTKTIAITDEKFPAIKKLST